MVVVKQAGPKAPLNVVDMLSQSLQAMAITDADIKTQDGLSTFSFVLSRIFQYAVILLTQKPLVGIDPRPLKLFGNLHKTRNLASIIFLEGLIE
jgi:hypothetical protein